MQFREATPDERKRFYSEEWNKKDLPDFILHTLSLREFGFDYGAGPSHRYNQFMTVEQLSDFLKNRAPCAAYASVALYEQPSMRKGWLKSELVFDVDAKDLPLKTCGCSGGAVCEKCLDEARQIAAMFAETLQSDLDLRNINFVYSGRGFHIRVNDDAVMTMEQTERTQIVEYVTGSIVPTDMTIALGYSQVFRDRIAKTFDRLDEQKLMEMGMRAALVQQLIKEKDKVIAMMRKGKLQDLQDFPGMGEKTFGQLVDHLMKLNTALTDGKVTIDTKRILRLPSSLHSGVSMKCVLVRDIEHFSIESAIPKFMREGK